MKTKIIDFDTQQIGKTGIDRHDTDFVVHRAGFEIRHTHMQIPYELADMILQSPKPSVFCMNKMLYCIAKDESRITFCHTYDSRAYLTTYFF